PKGLSILQMVYHPDRIKQPLKRIGERGEGRWQSISWEEAYDTTAARFNDVLAKYGPSAVTWSWGDAALHCHYLTKQAWLCAMNAPNHFHSDAHYCFHPVMIANKVTFGDFLTSETGPDYQNAKCIFLWGGNPAMSHPVAARNIMIGRRRGAKLIVVDPRFTEMAAKADLFLQPRPATDDALALGILHVIIRERLYDKAFVAKWCVGFDELKKRVQEYPPQKVAEITWIETEEIIRAAIMYATNRPGTVHTRMGALMNTNAIQTVRAIGMLPAICGDLDVKGGNLLTNKPVGFKSRHEIISEDLKQPAEIEDQRIGAREFPLLCGSQSLAHNNSHPPSVVHAMITGKPYPIKALWACNNLLLALEDARETKQALLNLDFLVGSDFFLTPTMELCDIILPPCSYLAREEVVQGYHTTNFFGARQKVIGNDFDTRDEREMTYEIIKRMGLAFPADWDTIEKQNEMRVRDMGMTFAELKRTWYFLGPIRYKKYEERGFRTPSGKVELFSSILEKFGYDPLPHY
ncbi:MAG: molybdopterin-dependent oxidoreductase, partial [Proteobacteria bacterium]|nr:molybdopterin-dependent oxidoreductase [Pseudomonadota bacterium]